MGGAIHRDLPRGWGDDVRRHSPLGLAGCPWAASHEVQVAASAEELDAATPLWVATSQYRVTTALAFGTWCRRVRAADEAGAAAAWSDAHSFTLKAFLAQVSVMGGTFQMGSVAGDSDELCPCTRSRSQAS